MFKRANPLKIVEITNFGAELRFEAIPLSSGHYKIIQWGVNSHGESTQEVHAHCGSREKAVEEMDDLFNTLASLRRTH